MEKFNNYYKLGLVAVLLSACNPTVKVEAPKEPIVIDLNINIEHKIKVQIDKDIDNLLKNSDNLF